MNLGSTIKSIRKKRKFTQSYLAIKADIKQAYLSGIETGKKQPSMDVIDKISNALGLSTPFLIFYSIDDNDVPEDKKSMYKILQPHMKQMVDEIVSNATYD